MAPVTPFVTGLVSGLALIVAIGAQNAWLLRQGIRRERVGVIVAICVVADAALIAAGTAGIGAVSRLAPWVLTALRWGGAAYLIWFAYTSFRSAARSRALTAAEPPRAMASVVLTTLALTLLNPQVYLDTVVMVGTVTTSFGDDRWIAAAGAMTASLIWFPSLGLAARALAPVLDRPRFWRWLDLAVGVVMVLIALRLIAPSLVQTG